MTTLAEHIIIVGAENRPSMLEKSMYDSWASRIHLFIKGKKNGRMMLDSIDNGPLVYPTVVENRQTQPKKYFELTEAQKLQDDCGVQVTNIILYGLPPDVYAFVSHQEAAKDIWDKVKLLMKGTELSYQELMVIDDKSWTLLECHERAFYIGLEKFVNQCKPLVNSVGKIRCPCKSCQTILWVSIKHLSDHIMRHVFDLCYKTWVHHGEPDLPLPPPLIDNTRQPQMSDMTTLLNDLGYIPLNNEHNETSNEPNQATRNEFEELYSNANEELYPGCDYVTRLDFMANFTYFKVKGKLTDSIFNEMLEFFRNVFPISKGYKLPPSYYAIKKTFEMIGLGWKDNNTPGKKVHTKVLRYFLIIPRLQRLCKSSHTTKETIWQATGKCTEPGKMQHPVDSRAWKNIDTKYLDFAKEPRNVRLGLAADDFNPFGNLSQAYSMWPVILTPYNLPPWLCMKKSSFMLTLLIPGPKSLGKDIDIYLRPLIEDLKACPTCNEDTPSVRVLIKTAYVGHRRFLKKPYKWRSSREFNGQTDNRDPPKEFGRDEILAQLDRLLMCLTDTAKARQDLQRLSIRSGLWFGQTKNRKCLKPYVVYSFTPENRKKFCQFIKGVKLPDGFGSCFKYKVTDNDTNITGLKCHYCHIMMHRLLPYGLQNYLPDKIAKPIIELCSLFKQICSATLMEDDMLKAQIKVVDILCDLELIYPHALFVIMIHLVIHLPLEALEGGPIRLRWMFPFERYIKKLKGYVRNKAKLKSSIAEGYVAEEALSFSSHYFRDVTTKFNHPDRNVDPPPPTCQFQVFRSVYNDKDPEVSTTSELFTLACGPTWTPISINSFVVDGVRYVMHNRDECRTTQNSGICSPGPDGEMYYGRKVKRLVLRNNMTQIDTRGEAYKNYQYILVTQVKQVFYLEDKAKPHLKVIEHVNHKKFSDGGVIVVEDEPDIINFDNSSDLLLSISLNDLDNATLHIDGQSTEVDALPDIIDVVDEDDDIVKMKTPFLMLADVARSHGGNGGGEDRPPLHHVPTGCEGCFANRGGRAAGRLHTRDKTHNLSLKEITDKKAPVPNRFEVRDKQNLMPFGDHAAHGSSYIGEVIKGVPLYYPYWLKVPKERKAALIKDIGTESYNVEKIRRARPEAITAEESDKYIQFWNDPMNIARATQNRQNQAKITVISRQGSRSLARLRDEMRQSSATQEYSSPIDTFFVAHTVNGVFTRDEDRLVYEMRRLEATGTYTDDKINCLARRGKQRGHIPDVGRVLPAWVTAGPMGVSGAAGAGMTRRVLTIRRTRMRMAMAIVSCVIYWLVCYIVTLCSSWRPGICVTMTHYLTENYVGPTVSLRIVAGERIPSERSPANILQRHVAREMHPQRQVARKRPEISLENVGNVVVGHE
nr:hypothetical protein [Tanacetum cinerariifolium]